MSRGFQHLFYWLYDIRILGVILMQECSGMECCFYNLLWASIGENIISWKTRGIPWLNELPLQIQSVWQSHTRQGVSSHTHTVWTAWDETQLQTMWKLLHHGLASVHLNKKKTPVSERQSNIRVFYFLWLGFGRNICIELRHCFPELSTNQKVFIRFGKQTLYHKQNPWFIDKWHQMLIIFPEGYDTFMSYFIRSKHKPMCRRTEGKHMALWVVETFRLTLCFWPDEKHINMQRWFICRRCLKLQHQTWAARLWSGRDMMSDSPTEHLLNTVALTHTDRQTHNKTNSETDRQTDRKVERQTDS